MDLKILLKEAKEQLIKDGKIMPKVMAISKDNNIIFIPTPFQTDAEKDLVRDMLQKTILLMDIKEYYCIQEIWLSQPNKNRIQTRARRDIDRKEAITIMKFTPTSAESILSIFKKDIKGKFTFEDIEAGQWQQGSSNYWDVFNYNQEVIAMQINSHNQEVIKGLAKEVSGKFEKEFFACKTGEERMKVFCKIIKEGERMKQEQDKMQLEDTDEVKI